MNKIGIIGGIGPESTIEYYRLIINLFRERMSTGQYPEILLYSVNMTEMLGLVVENDLEGLVEFLKVKIQKLEESNVDYVALASNTPHLVFEELESSVGVKMISIVEETCKKISETGLRKVGLLGTKSTMSKGFYQRIGVKYGVEIIAPNEEDQSYVHEKYMNELIFNQINAETKERLVQIVEGMEVNENIDGVILGGTELPLILKQDDFKRIRVFNTTLIHVNSILDAMIG